MAAQFLANDGSVRFSRCTNNNFACRPDDQARGLDAFAMDTWPDYSYAFRPVPLIAKCLTKIKYLDATVIMVTPTTAGNGSTRLKNSALN